MKIVMVESPFEPSREVVAQYRGRYSAAELLRQNLVYARRCLCHALSRGESPIASHLLFGQIDAKREEIDRAAAELYHRVDAVAFYIDLGFVAAMRDGQAHARLLGLEVTHRILFNSAAEDVRAQLASCDLVTFPRLEDLRARVTP
jgi:hypothetical protein